MNPSHIFLHQLSKNWLSFSIYEPLNIGHHGGSYQTEAVTKYRADISKLNAHTTCSVIFVSVISFVFKFCQHLWETSWGEETNYREEPVVHSGSIKISISHYSTFVSTDEMLNLAFVMYPYRVFSLFCTNNKATTSFVTCHNNNDHQQHYRWNINWLLNSCVGQAVVISITASNYCNCTLNFWEAS